MAHDIVVYGLKGSPFVRKVMIALDEKGVGFDMEAVQFFPAPDWYAEISPLKKMPAFRDRRVGTDGKAGTLADSSIICAYLERRYPEPPLYPDADYDYARALWFEEYADSEMASKFGGGMFRPAVLPQILGGEPDFDTARKTLRELCPIIFDYLEGEVPGDGFIIGDKFSIADLAVGCQFVNFHFAGGVLDAARWPRLASYVKFILSRPAFAKRIEEEGHIMPKVDLGL